MKQQYFGKRQTGAAAVIAGLAAMIAVYTFLEALFNVAPVVVAKSNIATGTMITASMVEIKRIPKGTLPVATYGAVSNVVGKTLRLSRLRGDAISTKCVTRSPKEPNPTALVGQDKVVFLLPVSDVLPLKGFLRQGAKINVIAVPDRAGENGGIARTILADVKIIKTPDFSRSETAEKTVGVLIDVSRAESERLSESLGAGSIRIAVTGYQNE